MKRVCPNCKKIGDIIIKSYPSSRYETITNLLPVGGGYPQIEYDIVEEECDYGESIKPPLYLCYNCGYEYEGSTIEEVYRELVEMEEVNG